jgi:hypothetical protein
MLCQRCGVREARVTRTSCNGVECYELHLCLECSEGSAAPPTPEQQRAVVASAMAHAREAGLDAEAVSRALGLDSEELRRILRGDGASTQEAWDAIRRHLRTDPDEGNGGDGTAAASAEDTGASPPHDS